MASTDESRRLIYLSVFGIWLVLGLLFAFLPGFFDWSGVRLQTNADIEELRHHIFGDETPPTPHGEGTKTTMKSDDNTHESDTDPIGTHSHSHSHSSSSDVDLVWSSSELPALVLSSSTQQLESIQRRIQQKSADIEADQKVLASLKSKRGWRSAAPPNVELAISRLEVKLEQQSLVIHKASQALELLQTRHRAMTPILSSYAVAESKQVFSNVQFRHKDVSVSAWKWDIFFSSIFGGFRDTENIGEVIASIIIKLAFQLTFGVLFGCIDFMIRLPFYLKEYGIIDLTKISNVEMENIYGATNRNIDEFLRAGSQAALSYDPASSSASSSSSSSSSHNIDPAAELHLWDYLLSELAAENSRIMFSASKPASWIPSAAALLLWSGAVSFGFLCGIALILVIWSPCIGFGVWAYRQRRRQQPYRYQNQHYD